MSIKVVVGMSEKETEMTFYSTFWVLSLKGLSSSWTIRMAVSPLAVKLGTITLSISVMKNSSLMKVVTSAFYVYV